MKNIRGVVGSLVRGNKSRLLAFTLDRLSESGERLSPDVRIFLPDAGEWKITTEVNVGKRRSTSDIVAEGDPVTIYGNWTGNGGIKALSVTNLTTDSSMEVASPHPKLGVAFIATVLISITVIFCWGLA